MEQGFWFAQVYNVWVLVVARLVFFWLFLYAEPYNSHIYVDFSFQSVTCLDKVHGDWEEDVR